MASFSMEETMEEAIENLQHTFCLAQICQKKPATHSREIFSHVKALEEDLAALSITKTQTPETVDLAKNLKKEALNLKRSLEREALTLHKSESDAASSTTTTTEKLSPTKTEDDQHKVKLHSLKIPTFYGDPSQFRLFFDIYNENVETNSKLTDTAKWVYLDESIKGPAADLISKLPRRPETRKIAIKMLETRYGSLDRTLCDIYQQLQSMPPATLEDEKLRLTQAQIEGLLLSLEELGHDVNSNDFIKSVVKGKFPKEFLHLVVTHPQADNLRQIRANLQTVIEARERVLSDVVYTNEPSKSTPTRTPQMNAAGSSGSSIRSSQTARPAQRPLRCMFCSGPHWSDECPLYPTIAARIERLVGRCHQCFRIQHEGKCLTEKRCAHCDDPTHNRALCPKKFKQSALYATTSSPLVQSGKDGVYLTFLLNVSSEASTKPCQLRAVLDSGGATSILTTQAAKQLGITLPNSPDVPLSGLGNTDLPGIKPTNQKLYLHTPDDEKIQLSICITPIIANDLPAADITEFRTRFPQHNDLPIPPTGAGQAVDLLLGKDTLTSICTLNKSLHIDDNHQLLSTKFGFLVLGTRADHPKENSDPHFYFAPPAPDDLRNFWQLDTIGLHDVETTNTEQEEAALQQFYSTITFTQGRYQIGWPFITFPPLLNVDYGLALGHLRSVWRRLQQDPTLLSAYNQIITDQLEQNIIEPVTPATPQNTKILHYIPHHPIVRQDKSTKIRIVFDASAKSTPGAKSLNDNLHVGGNWVKDLLSVIIRLRQQPIVVTADIAKAFLQIMIRPEDRDAIRFLWLHDPTKPPETDNVKIFRFCRMAFGIISSPFLLAATIQHHLHTHPTEINELIERNLYADNLVLSLPEHFNCIQFYETTKNVFETMGMDMTQWATNSSSLLEHIPAHDRNEAITQTILGLQWHSIHDTLHIRPPHQLQATDHILTKRKALQQMASVFDPIGVAAPLVVRAKIFIRKLWANRTTWDEQLLLEKRQEWHTILADLRKASNIEIKRQYFPNLPATEITSLQIHAFADASNEAYASVLYLRATTSTSSKLAFLAAKTRLTPQKRLTIPRLELLAILTTCRFANFIAAEIKGTTPIQIVVWSDSRCALMWICNEKILPAVIQRQISEIHTHKNFAFHHVASAENYADVASRGTQYAELANMKWWNGPAWLLETENWPQQKDTTHDNLHAAKNELHLHFHHTLLTQPTSPPPPTTLMDINYAAIASMPALLIRVATCCKALNLLLKKQLLPITTYPDIHYAEFLLIRHEQQQHYPHLYNTTHPPSTLHNIRIQLDDKNIIRCITRITKANLQPTTMMPILLVKGTRLTELLVLEAHTHVGHAGTSHTLAHLRTKYWLPQGRREIFRIVRQHCYRCKRFDAKPYATPTAPPLPEFRVTRTERPFETVGLDIFGPYQVRHNTAAPTNTSKNWVLLITCAVTRAIHLEILHDMSTIALIDALHRFISRRGSPKLIVADNAPQFRLLDEKMRLLWRSIDQQPQTVAYFAQQRIHWKFLPPGAPWMGGFYERLVGTIKRAFDKTYQTNTLLQRQFETSIIEIEGILNSRPLTYIDTEIDTKIITPFDFLRIKYPAIPIDQLPSMTADRILHLWRDSQQHVNEFWSNWSTQYLLHLRDRDDKLKAKPGNELTQPQVGDIVLLIDPEKTRNAWKIAKIETLILSNDGVARSALVNLGHNHRLVKPIIKLAPLGLRADAAIENAPQLTDSHDAIIVDNTPFDPATTQPEDEVIEIQIDDDW